MFDFLNEANALFEYTRQLRRDFHRHPELGFQEVRTAGIVARELNQLGLEVTTGVGKTGVVALLEGARPGPVVLLRFDMDALPIQEETGAEYSSERPGVMHACGHDGHTAIGLAVARILEAQRASLAGMVKFVFQPAEEGLGGAQAMIADGVLQDPKPDISLALHLWNERPSGWLGIPAGPLMAAGDLFQVRISGRGGHGAAPHLAIDPLLAAAQIITALQSIVARNVAPLESAVISVTSVKGGEAFNVIPPMVEMQGTIRTFEPQVRALVLERFTQVVTGVAQAMVCQAEVVVQSLTSAVVNDAGIAQRIQAVAERLLPDYRLDTVERTMVSEDMAEMMQEIPGCYFLIGSANARKGLNAAHHHPRFDFDEEVLPPAAALMASAAAEFLGG
jgi:amidohydrolase